MTTDGIKGLRRSTGIAALLALLTTGMGQSVAPDGSADRNLRRRSPIVEVVEATKDSVVNISSTQIISVRTATPFGSLFDEFFDRPRHRTRRYERESVGSGFVLHESGYVITNAHVLTRAADCKVIFADDREYDAEVVAVKHASDLALLKIHPEQPLSAIRLGRSDDLMVGETVVAIGNPLGYERSVTAGVISALNRELHVRDDVQFTDLIQTDASINPGNSGGPLLNILGELVGINVAIRADAQNIGFAVPVDRLRELLPSMLDVERRYKFGLGMQVDHGTEARVTSVVRASPAAKAGVRVGDRVVELDGQAVTSGLDAAMALIGRASGQRIAVKVQRDGKQRLAKVVLSEPPPADGAALLKAKLGIEARRFTRDLAVELRLPGLSGLLITNVEPGSPADLRDFRPGQVILHLRGQRVEDLEDAGNLLERVGQGQRIAVDALVRMRSGLLVRRTVELVAR